MTCKEFDIKFDKIDIIEGVCVGYNCEQTDKLVDAYIDSLEAIAELEAPKNYNGCKWHGCNYDIYQDVGKQCNRVNKGIDYYEPKDNHD